LIKYIVVHPLVDVAPELEEKIAKKGGDWRRPKVVVVVVVDWFVEEHCYGAKEA